MTFFFNLETLERETKCDPEYLVEALRLYYIRKSIPKNIHVKFKPINNLVGNSFLINPSLFFSDTITDILFKAQYIRLAGRRDYGAYKHFNIKHLDLSFFADLDISKIKNNPLLSITKNNIHFKYEEI